MYNKLFTKILDSSIWLESLTTRIVWLTMIAAMDEDGFVQFASVQNLALRARVPLTACEKAVACLESADDKSADPDNDGRRIERVPGGWMVLNAKKYRDLVTRVVVQAQTRERVAKYRANKRGNAPVTDESVTPKACNAPVTPSEAATETKIETRVQQKMTPADARSKRPIFKGQRLVVFEWQVDDLRRMLGSHTDAFDLHEWFFTLDVRMAESDVVLPTRDGGKWLQMETLAEAQRRGLPVATAPATSGRTAGNRAALARFASRVVE